MTYRVAVVLGIRPDFIRTSKILKLLEGYPGLELSIIHTGQHYDSNLNDVFFSQMDIPKVTHQLETRGRNHNEQHSKLIIQLSDALQEIQPHVCVFLGDANAVVGCIAPLKLGIPIAHIEAGMRSYNWDMPEERNRVLIDRVSDVLYVYQDDYRVQLIQEGVPASKIVVTGNVIVDVMEEHGKERLWPFWGAGMDGRFPMPMELGGTRLLPKKYALMTLHRNEHMEKPHKAISIIRGVGHATRLGELNIPVVLIEMPRLKALVRNLGFEYPPNFFPIEPQGFFEFYCLENNAMIEYTDSGTNQEVASILGTPCIVTRDCTERPECARCDTTILASPENIRDASYHVLSCGHNKSFTLGDGHASERIVTDLIERIDRDFDRGVSPCTDLFKLKHFEQYVHHSRGIN